MQRRAGCLKSGTTCFVYEEGRTFLLYVQEVTAPLSNYQIVVAEAEVGFHETYVVFLEEKVSLMLWATRDGAERMLADLLASYQDDVLISNPVPHMLAYGIVNPEGVAVTSPLPYKVLN